MTNQYQEFTLTIYTANGVAYHETGQRLDNVQDTLDYYLERYDISTAEVWQDAAHPLEIYASETAQIDSVAV